MPLYEYQCQACQSKFSDLRKSVEKDDPIACPECGKSKSKRMFATFAMGSSASSASSCAQAPSCSSAGGFG